jgi:hypothetical protein
MRWQAIVHSGPASTLLRHIGLLRSAPKPIGLELPRHTMYGSGTMVLNAIPTDATARAVTAAATLVPPAIPVAGGKPLRNLLGKVTWS